MRRSHRAYYYLRIYLLRPLLVALVVGVVLAHPGVYVWSAVKGVLAKEDVPAVCTCPEPAPSTAALR